MSGAAIESIENYLAVSERLATGGQPDAAHFASLAAAGYEVVINLAMPDSERALPDEGCLVTQQGMTYVHLPVPWEAPSLAHLRQFFGLLDVFSEASVFVHCVKNMRVSAFIYLYRVCREGMSAADVEADLTRIWQPNAVWQELIDAATRDPRLCKASL